MSAKIRYTDEPLGRIRIVPDFLPRPEDLVFRDDGVKITISLSKRSVEFFKHEAGKHKTQYQRMIRRLLDASHTARAAPERIGRRPGRPRAPAEARDRARVAARSAVPRPPCASALKPDPGSSGVTLLLPGAALRVTGCGNRVGATGSGLAAAPG